MEPKKVTINYALLCKELEKQGKTKEKFSAELGVRIQTTGYGKNVKAWWSLKGEQA